MPETKTKDWVTPVVIVLGAGGIATGLYFALRKPPGISPGGVIRATFTFDYLGDEKDYVLLVRFGYYKIILGKDWFDPEEGLDQFTKRVPLPGPDSYKFNVDCVIPDGAKPDTYDAEGSILTPEMAPGKDWILRVFKKSALTVRKEET